MSWDPTCPEPLHRLAALVGEEAINSWLDDGTPSIAAAVVMAALDDLPEHLYPQAVELLIEAGLTTNPEACRANPHAALLAAAAAMAEVHGVDLSDV